MRRNFKAHHLSFFFLIASSLVYGTNELPSYITIEDKAAYPLLNPALKDRKIAKIQLSNGVEAYLVSDPEIDQSAAAVSMEAGSWQDPAEYPGMAHFLEHMLFMGNQAYPKECEYMEYIKDNGGAVNAFTASDRTVYMFSINNEAYEGALDRFSHFFIDPLFSPSCINRELHAVDQENSKNIENDFWREHMVFKATSSLAHPNTKFSTGNAQTLGGIPQEAVKAWYKSHYSADKLHLVMLSCLPLEQMIELVTSKFSAVAKVDSTPPPISYGPMLSSEQQGHFIYIKPIKDLRILSIVWELPKEFASIDEKWTAELVSYALSEASDNSLIKELKKEQIAESLTSGVERFGKGDLLFRIDIKLTEKGLSNIDTAIFRCFQTLARLKQSGLPLSLFQEMQKMSAINYQYQSRAAPFEWITDVAYNIVDENLSTFPEKTEIPSYFNPESLMLFVSSLTPEAATYLVLADPSKLGVETNLKEKWMNVHYSVSPIPPSKIANWQHATPNPEITLPPLNPFVPTSLELVSEKISKKEISPKLLTNTEKAKIYFSNDNRYEVPEASLFFTLKAPLLSGSASSSALEDLFCKAFQNELSSTLFFAENAGLFSSISPGDLALSITISGYSEKVPELTAAIFAKLKTISCSKEDFLIYKTSLLSSYGNAAHELPVKQAMNCIFSILLNDAPTPSEKLSALQALSYEEFLAFCQNWLDSIYLEGMIYGNLTEEKADIICKTLQEELSSSLPYIDPKKQEVLILPSDKGPFKVVQKTDRQGNGTVLIVQQGPFSFEKRASQILLSTALQKAFFDTLRTKQQTGYIAQSWASDVENQLFQTFAVQSSSHDPEDLLLRFEMFLEDFDKRLVEIIPEERFTLLKKVQITSLEMPPENLYGMGARLANLAFEHDGDFNWKEKQIQALQNLTYEDLLKDAHLFLAKSNAKRLAVLIEGQPEQKRAFKYETLAKEEILKVGMFSTK